MDDNLPFRITSEVRGHLQKSPIRKENCDLAFDISESEFDGVYFGPSIGLCGYEKGTLPKDSFYSIEGMMVSISGEVLEIISGQEIFLEKRPFRNKETMSFMWVRP